MRNMGDMITKNGSRYNRELERELSSGRASYDYGVGGSPGRKWPASGVRAAT